MTLKVVGFPQATEFNKRIPKQKFYENLDVSPALRRVFVDQIRLVYWRNNLNQLTVMARQGRITQVNYEPFTEVYRNAWQTLNSLLSHAV